MNNLKSLAKTIIPPNIRSWIGNLRQEYRQFNREAKNIWRGFQYAGNQFVCPCCGGHFREFLTYGVVPRPNAQCPRCLSLERHRLLWIYLQQQTNLFTASLKVLHIAPERWFQQKFKTLSNLDYLSADLDSSWAMEKMDITNIQYPDNSFDVILCNHVLEHIPDDHKAMQELCRVLKPEGWAILQVPMDLTRQATFEDPTITSPEAREKIFGQKDHVRIYGQDYGDRLTKAGFQVKVDSYVKDLAPEIVQKYSIIPEHNIYFCTKATS